MQFKAGIDIGSTTIKMVVLDDKNKTIFSCYERHFAHIQDTLIAIIKKANEVVLDNPLTIKITGSGSLNFSKALNIEFIQEVVAVATALKSIAPQVDVAIELGGEDAKIIYFTGGLEERMNGVCAGGTGSFIDQMAALLQTDAEGLNKEAKNYKEIYPIAARCGVFAKSDIQPLINEGATKADLAISIFQAVVNQTISGLACGKPIRGCVAFLGGPLHFLSELKECFIRTLKLTSENVVAPSNGHLLAAIGAALESEKEQPIFLKDLIKKLENGVSMEYELKRLEPLFASRQEYLEFNKRHEKAMINKVSLNTYRGNCFLGIDAGSTTTKLVLIGEKGELLYSFYSSNQGNPINTAIVGIRKLAQIIPDTAKIVRSCSTGYGESLFKAAFNLEEGEVETIVHCKAAQFFNPDVDCVLDIGGQDMKYIKLKNGNVDNVLLNEACSSGCGSFIENFAVSLGYSVQDFAKEALFAANPIDLGTRCTVFMNSNVKQAQKEGASVADISAGLAYSVIKNALYKVIKLSNVADLGKNIVVQGGTFLNKAVLRAFEKIAGVEVINPNISGLMGAFGAALHARETYTGQTPAALSLKEMINLTYKTTATRCQGCSNHCMLTINIFSGGRRHITGNRCEKGLNSDAKATSAFNMVKFKRDLMDSYKPLSKEEATRGTIGIPRVLNIYENYPFWLTFFKELGFRVELSSYSSRKIYELGMDSIPSESECYPAKLAHGHVQWLVNQGVKTIFHPCVFFEHQETKKAQNHYNCPIVISYPENLKNNVEAITNNEVHYVRPFIAFTNEKVATNRLIDVCKKEWNIKAGEVKKAAHIAWLEQEKNKQIIKEQGRKIIDSLEENNQVGIVLAGRPYHIDPEINHGIPEMIASFNYPVLTEDSIPDDFEATRPIRVNDQWVYHSRLYKAAEYVKNNPRLELVQLNSFGCGLDAITTDQVNEILERGNKMYTVLKIDEVNNLGAARIRIRSLFAAIKKRNNKENKVTDITYKRSYFTKKMKQEGWTILAPQMSPIHFDLVSPVFKYYGYQLELLENMDRNAIDAGLKFVNNDACYPSIITVGQIMDAVLSKKYDTNRLAIVMTQTGGCCRASNYVGFIRRALDKVGLSHIPVISLNLNGMETNEGFKITIPFAVDVARAVVYGDLFMRCLYHVRPYEKEVGSANKLHKELKELCVKSLTHQKKSLSYKKLCKKIVTEFDKLPINEDVVKPRVGVVGEILVKYMPLANNNVVKLLEKEGAEVVVPDLMDFLNYSVYNLEYRHKYLGSKWKNAMLARIGLKLVFKIRKPAFKALERSKRFETPYPIKKVAELAKPYLSIGNQYGEGWFLTGEMVELLQTNTPNIICIQPFACLPNHVVGKGVLKIIRKDFPMANIAAIDYDPGASEVNQLNRIKLMLSAAKSNLEKK